MKSVLRALPVVLASVVLAAHFFRSRNVPMVVLALAIPLLLPVRARWSARLARAGLILGALEWLRTLVFFAGQRMEAGRPWVRLAVILGTVAVLTALSAFAVRVPSARGPAVAPEPGREVVS